MNEQQAKAIIESWHKTLDSRKAQAASTGLPRGYRGRLFPDVFEAPEYWRARHVLREISDAEYAEIVEMQKPVTR